MKVVLPSLFPRFQRRWSVTASLLIGLAGLGSGANSAFGLVVQVAYWHMGESDSNGVAGVTPFITKDSVSTNDLFFFTGTANYSTDVSPTAWGAAGSLLSVNFTNSAYAIRPVFLTNVDNFGVEAWVKPIETTNGQVIVYNGSTSTSGWGIFVDATGTYSALYGGKTVFGTIPATPGVWAHVALVRDSGNATIYVNGVAGGTSSALPATPAGYFAIGAPPQSQTSQFLTGFVDEVRVFTFTGGQFYTNDLLPNRINYTVTLNSRMEGPAADVDSIALVTYPANASWNAYTNAPWLHLSDANQSGVGSTNVVFSFDANPGGPRVGTVTVGDHVVTVTQAGSNYVAARPITTLISGLGYPSALIVDGSGNVIYPDPGNNVVNEWIASSNTITNLVPSSAGLNYPDGVAEDPAGNLYIADYQNDAIKIRYATNGLVAPLVTAGLGFVQAVALDSANNVYICDTTHNAVKMWSAVTGDITTLSTPGLNTPNGVAVDAARNVYFTDSGNFLVREWLAANSNVVNVVGGLHYPAGMTIDGSGDVYIADNFNYAVRRWRAANGQLLTLVGSGTFEEGVAVDANQNVYYAETANGVIKELPHAFVDPTPKTEPLTAGTDSLPMVLPANENLSGPFTPVSDESWLTITGITNGVVSFAYTATSSPRQGHIMLLGQSIPVTQGVLSAPVTLTGVQVLSPGVVTFSFTNFPGTTFEVITTTNLALPLSQWTSLGAPMSSGPGQFQFTSSATTNDVKRFYGVRVPE